jgi:hypothetical protein
MAARKTADEFIETADVTESPEGWEWETVAEAAATKVVFDTIGDSFVGQFQNAEYIEREPAADGSDQSFTVYLFKGRDGDLYSIQQSFSLEEAMKKVSTGDWTRITYVKDVPTARKLNDMKSFQVDIRSK